MDEIGHLYEAAIAYDRWGKRVCSVGSRDVNQRSGDLREQEQLDDSLRMLALLYVPEVRPKAQALIKAADDLETEQARLEAAERSKKGSMPTGGSAGPDLVAMAERVTAAADGMIQAFVSFQAALGTVAEGYMQRRSWRQRWFKRKQP